MSEIDYLVNGVIYGFGETEVEEPVQTKSSKISKSTASNSESQAKEAYNRNKISDEDASSMDEKDNNQEKTNGLKSFFKKFFD